MSVTEDDVLLFLARQKKREERETKEIKEYLSSKRKEITMANALAELSPKPTMNELLKRHRAKKGCNCPLNDKCKCATSS